MLNINKFKSISFLKFLTLFTAYIFFINYIFLYKGVLSGFLQNNQLYFSIFFFLIFAIVFILVFASIFCILFVPFLLKPIIIILILASGISAYFMQAYGVIIDKNMLLNVLHTDTKEAFSYFSTGLVFWIIITTILPCVYVAFVKINYGSFKNELKLRAKIISFSIVAIAIIFSLTSKIFIPFFREHSNLRTALLPYYPIYSAIKLAKSITQKPLPFTYVADDAVLADNKKKILVLIVGETQRSRNYSLNGYTKNDTNKFTKQKGVVSFTNFYSCGTATETSVPCLFSDLKRENFSNREAKARENLVDIINKLGIKTYFFGNNSGGCKGVCDNLDQNHTSDHRAEGFDEVIFDEAKKVIKDANSTTFIVLHLQGSHGPIYYKGYPSKFKEFTPTCDTAELNKCTPEEIANTYDNTILYEDYLQSELINALEARKDEFEVTMFFFSDHGESLGENGIYLHGLPYSIAPDEQKHIPAIIFSSDSELLKRLKTRKDESLSHDFIFSSVLGYFGIKTKAYEPEFDIFR